MFLGFISSLQFYAWGELALAEGQNLLLIKIELDGEKRKTKIKTFPLPPFLFFLGSSPSLHPQLLYLCYPTSLWSSAGGWGMGDCGWCIRAPLCLSFFLLTLSLCSRVVTSHGLQFFRINLCLHGLQLSPGNIHLGPSTGGGMYTCSPA